jgi:hypothetical protein
MLLDIPLVKASPQAEAARTSPRPRFSPSERIVKSI